MQIFIKLVDEHFDFMLSCTVGYKSCFIDVIPYVVFDFPFTFAVHLLILIV